MLAFLGIALRRWLGWGIILIVIGGVLSVAGVDVGGRRVKLPRDTCYILDDQQKSEWQELLKPGYQITGSVVMVELKNEYGDHIWIAAAIAGRGVAVWSDGTKADGTQDGGSVNDLAVLASGIPREQKPANAPLSWQALEAENCAKRYMKS